MMQSSYQENASIVLLNVTNGYRQ